MAEQGIIDLSPEGVTSTVITPPATDYIKQGLEAVGSAWRGATVGAKQTEAKEESNKLIDKFTQASEYQQLSQSLSEAEVEKKEILYSYSDSGDTPDFSEDDQLKLKQIEELQSKLSDKRSALMQGLMTSSEFKREAEAMLYQISATTPGLVDEIASTIQGIVGFDPRSQNIKLAMEERDQYFKNQGQAAEAQQKLIEYQAKKIIDMGFGDSTRQSAREIVETYLEQAQQAQSADTLANQLQNLDQIGEIQNTQQLRTHLHKMRTSHAATAWSALKTLSLVDINGAMKSLFKMSPSDVLALSDEQKQAYLNRLNTASIELVQRYENHQAHFTSINEGQAFKHHIEAVKQMQTDLIAIIQSTDIGAITGTRLQYYKDVNDIALELEASQLLGKHPNLLTIVTMADRFGLKDLLVDAAQQGATLDILSGILLGSGDVDYGDPDAMSTGVREIVVSGQIEWLKKARDWADRNGVEDLTPEEAKGLGNVLKNVMRQPITSLGSNEPLRWEVLETLSNKKLMDNIKNNQPRLWAIIEGHKDTYLGTQINSVLAPDLQAPVINQFGGQSIRLLTGAYPSIVTKDGKEYLMFNDTEFSKQPTWNWNPTMIRYMPNYVRKLNASPTARRRFLNTAKVYANTYDMPLDTAVQEIAKMVGFATGPYKDEGNTEAPVEELREAPQPSKPQKQPENKTPSEAQAGTQDQPLTREEIEAARAFWEQHKDSQDQDAATVVMEFFRKGLNPKAQQHEDTP